jgi:hypothetical protein
MARIVCHVGTPQHASPQQSCILICSDIATRLASCWLPLRAACTDVPQDSDHLCAISRWCLSE